MSINVTCEASILHVYHNTATADLFMINPIVSLNAANPFGIEKSTGDPDNSPFTAGTIKIVSVLSNANMIYLILLHLCIRIVPFL